MKTRLIAFTIFISVIALISLAAVAGVLALYGKAFGDAHRSPKITVENRRETAIRVYNAFAIEAEDGSPQPSAYWNLDSYNVAVLPGASESISVSEISAYNRPDDKTIVIITDWPKNILEQHIYTKNLLFDENVLLVVE